jgi:hypothetical protein
MSDLAPVPLPASEATSPHTEILRTNSAMLAQAASGTGSPERVMMILNLCRESNPSADALAQLLRDPSTSAGVNYEDVNSMTPLIEGKRCAATFFRCKSRAHWPQLPRI